MSLGTVISENIFLYVVTKLCHSKKRGQTDALFW